MSSSPRASSSRRQTSWDCWGRAIRLASALRAMSEYYAGQTAAGKSDAEPYPLLLVRPTASRPTGGSQAALNSWGSDFGYELIGADWKLALPERRLAAGRYHDRSLPIPPRSGSVRATAQLARGRTRKTYHASTAAGSGRTRFRRWQRSRRPWQSGVLGSPRRRQHGPGRRRLLGNGGRGPGGGLAGTGGSVFDAAAQRSGRLARVPLTSSAPHCGQAGGGASRRRASRRWAGRWAMRRQTKPGGVDPYGQPIAGSGGGSGEAAAGDPNAQLSRQRGEAGETGNRYGTAASPYGSNVLAGRAKRRPRRTRSHWFRPKRSPATTPPAAATALPRRSSSGAQTGSPASHRPDSDLRRPSGSSGRQRSSSVFFRLGHATSMNVQMGGGPASQQAPQEDTAAWPMPAAAIGDCPKAAAGMSAATRPILVYCSNDRLIIPSDRANQPPTEIKVGAKARTRWTNSSPTSGST